MRYLLEILWVTVIELTGYLFGELWVIIFRQDIFRESVLWWLFQWISFAEGCVWLLIEWELFKKGVELLWFKGDHYLRLRSTLRCLKRDTCQSSWDNGNNSSGFARKTKIYVTKWYSTCAISNIVLQYST